MAFSISDQVTKKGTKKKIHTSFRVNGRVSSATCGYIDNIEELKKEKGEKFDEYIKEEALRIYQEWKEQKKIKHTFTLIEGTELENYKEVYSSQIYLRKIWDSLGLPKLLNSIKADQKKKYKYDLNEVVFFLVTKQLIDASSKLKSYSKKEEYYFTPDDITLDSLYDCLDILADNSDYINLQTYKRALKYLDKKSRLYFYDATTVNFSQSVDESELIGIKKGKEGIYGPLVQIGYLCDEWGLLIGLIVFKGNRNEQGTLKEQITKIFEQNKLKDIVICTDAGLCSVSNKRYSESTFKGYITTQSLGKKKVPNAVREWAIGGTFKDNLGNEYTKEEIILRYEHAVEANDKELIKELLNKTYYKSKWYLTTVKIDKKGDETLSSIAKLDDSKIGKYSVSKLKEKDFKSNEKKTSVKVKFEQRLIVSFNLKYYLRQLEELDKDKEKALKAIEKQATISKTNKKDYRRFIKEDCVDENGVILENNLATFLEDDYEFEKSLCGIYCQATNLDDKENVLYRATRERWIIEYSFRTAKTYLGMGNVYLRTPKHIIGHFELCFLSQTLLRIFEYKIFNQLGLNDVKVGKANNIPSLTQDKIIEELILLKAEISNDDKNNPCIRSLRAKNPINKLMADAFKFSLTMQVRPVDDIKKFLKK